MVMLNQNMVKKQNYVIWIQTVSLHTYVILDTDSFIVYIETGDMHKDIAEDVETTFDTHNPLICNV